MLKKIEKYLYIASPLLILTSLFYYYLKREFELFSIIALVVGIGGGIIFFIRFYEDVVRKITRRKFRYGMNSVFITLVVLALVVIVYLVLMDNNKVFDLTKTKRFSLSEQTHTVLEKLEGPVNAYAFYSKQMEAGSIRELFNEYQYLYKDFEFQIIDPDLNPSMVKELGVEEYGELILKYGGKTEKVKSNNEEGITNALIKLSQTEVKKVYFVTGHSEHSVEDYSNVGYDKIKAAIQAENFAVEEILLLRTEMVPDDCALLISAGPKSDYTDYEISLIEGYIQEGGRVIFLIDPVSGEEVLPNIVNLLARYGLVAENDVIIDPLSRVLSGDFLMPVVNSYTYNRITKDFRFATIFKDVRSIDITQDPGENIFPRIIAHTAEASWAEKSLKELSQGGKIKFDEGVDRQGPVPIMAYSSIDIPSEEATESEEEPQTPEEEALVLAVGDSDFISNSMYLAQGNKDLFLNMVNFLTDRGEFITERPKEQESVYLTMTAMQGRLAFFITMIAVPLFVIIVGLYFTVRRRVKT